MNYAIAETFLSFQGEGIHAGRRAYFLRMFGCPVKCPWCDSVFAWNGKPREFADEGQLAPFGNVGYAGNSGNGWRAF